MHRANHSPYSSTRHVACKPINSSLNTIPSGAHLSFKCLKLPLCPAWEQGHARDPSQLQSSQVGRRCVKTTCVYDSNPKRLDPMLSLAADVRCVHFTPGRYVQQHLHSPVELATSRRFGRRIDEN